MCFHHKSSTDGQNFLCRKQSKHLFPSLILMTPVIDMDVWNIMWCVGITGLSKKLLQALAQIANLINYVDFCRLCCSLPDDGAKMSCLVDL
eukprot:m.41271 g.41271  ORF g.41271 m.41271 type:complete len:91 (+) comp33122_c0_seq4:1316-1588(+)